MMNGKEIYSIAGFCKALADTNRLRMLALLEQGPFNVNEISTILQIPQPRTSRHLKTLSNNNLIRAHREGPRIYYQLNHKTLPQELQQILDRFMIATQHTQTGQTDLAALPDILLQRSRSDRSFFDRIAHRWESMKVRHFDESVYQDDLRGLLKPQYVIADLGCATGTALRWLAPHCHSIIGIDHSSEMLKLASQNMQTWNIHNVELRLGELDHLPLRDSEVDVALAIMVLHHVPRPPAVFAELARILRQGGSFALVDLNRHQDSDFGARMGDLWLGFEQDNLLAWASQAGFSNLNLRVMQSSDRPDIMVLTGIANHYHLL